MKSSWSLQQLLYIITLQLKHNDKTLSLVWYSDIPKRNTLEVVWFSCKFSCHYMMGIRCFAPTVPSTIIVNSLCHSSKTNMELEVERDEILRSTWRKVSSNITPEFQTACIIIGVRRLRVWAYENPKTTPVGKRWRKYSHW